jgi:hypothetical protein
MRPGDKYKRKLWYQDETGAKRFILIDVYDVISSFQVDCAALSHAIKKLLCPGVRGHKTREQDLREAIVSIERAIDLTPPSPEPST